MDELSSQLNNIELTMERQAMSLSNLESEIKRVEDRVSPLEHTIHKEDGLLTRMSSLIQKVSSIEDSLDDLSTQARRIVFLFISSVVSIICTIIAAVIIHLTTK